MKRKKWEKCVIDSSTVYSVSVWRWCNTSEALRVNHKQSTFSPLICCYASCFLSLMYFKKRKQKNCTDPFSTATHLLVAVFFSFFFLNLSVKTRLPAESRNKKQVWATTNGSLHKNRAPLALTVLKELAGNVWSQNWFFFSPTQMYDGAVLPHSQPSSDHSLGATGSGQHGSLIWVDFPTFDNSVTHFSPAPLSLWQPILCCPFTEHKLTTGNSCRYCPNT